MILMTIGTTEMAKKIICSSCGKTHEYNSICICRANTNRNEYQRSYYEKNKEIQKALSSKRWKSMRSYVIHRDGGHCQRCRIKFGLINDEQLQVHHIKPRIEYPELMYEEENLITLCKTCNLQIGTAEKLDFIQVKKIQEFNL